MTGSDSVATLLGLNGSCSAASPCVAAIVASTSHVSGPGGERRRGVCLVGRARAGLGDLRLAQACCPWSLCGLRWVDVEDDEKTRLSRSLLHFTWNRRTRPRLDSRQPKATVQRYSRAKLEPKSYPFVMRLDVAISFDKTHARLQQLCSCMDVSSRLCGQAPSYTWRGARLPHGSLHSSPRTSRYRERPRRGFQRGPYNVRLCSPSSHTPASKPALADAPCLCHVPASTLLQQLISLIAQLRPECPVAASTDKTGGATPALVRTLSSAAWTLARTSVTTQKRASPGLPPSSATSALSKTTLWSDGSRQWLISAGHTTPDGAPQRG